MKKILLIVCLLTSACGVAQARELGHYVPGVANIRDLAVPAQPGFYYEQYNMYYSTNTYNDRNGDSVKTLTSDSLLDPDVKSEIHSGRQIGGL